MVLSYTTNLNLRKPGSGDTGWGTSFNSNFDDLDTNHSVAGLVVSINDPASPALAVDIAAGRFKDSSQQIVVYAGATNQAVTASNTNYVYLTDAGVLTINTTGFPTSGPFLPLAEVTTSGTAVTAIDDRRPVFSVVGSIDAPRIIRAERLSGTITGAGFQQVEQFSLGAGFLGTANLVRGEVLSDQTTGAGNTTYRLQYGATTIATLGASAPDFGVIWKIWGDGGTSAQRGLLIAAYKSDQFAFGTAAEDSTTALNITLAVDLATDSDVLSTYYSVAELIQT